MSPEKSFGRRVVDTEFSKIKLFISSTYPLYYCIGGRKKRNHTPMDCLHGVHTFTQVFLPSISISTCSPHLRWRTFLQTAHLLLADRGLCPHTQHVNFSSSGAASAAAVDLGFSTVAPEADSMGGSTAWVGATGSSGGTVSGTVSGVGSASKSLT